MSHGAVHNTSAHNPHTGQSAFSGQDPIRVVRGSSQKAPRQARAPHEVAPSFPNAQESQERGRTTGQSDNPAARRTQGLQVPTRVVVGRSRTVEGQEQQLPGGGRSRRGPGGVQHSGRRRPRPFPVPPEIEPIKYDTLENIIEGSNRWARAALNFRQNALPFKTRSMFGTYVGAMPNQASLLDYHATLDGAIHAANIALDQGATGDDFPYFKRALKVIKDSPHHAGGGVLSRFAGKLDYSAEIETGEMMDKVNALYKRMQG